MSNMKKNHVTQEDMSNEEAFYMPLRVSGIHGDRVFIVPGK